MFTPFSVIGCSLELLQPGERGIVTFCKTQDEAIRKRLVSMGVTTGAIISVEQRFPSLIIRVGNLSFNMEWEIARIIYVRVINI